MSEKTPNDHMDPTWKIRMEILMKRMKTIEISEKIEDAINQWYFDHGMEVPKWKVQKDPQWWIDYLKELDN
jgi:hypothetical protein